MSELRLPPEDMADIDRRFWNTVEAERRIFAASAGSGDQPHEPGSLISAKIQPGGSQVALKTAKR